MKRQLFIIKIAVLFVIMLPLLGFSQYSISGKIIDKSDGQLLVGAHIIIDDSYLSTTTNAQGQFVFKKIPAGDHTLKVSLA